MSGVGQFDRTLGAQLPVPDRRSGSRIPTWLPDLVTSTRIALAPVFLLAAEATRDASAAGLPSARLRVLTVLVLVAIAASDKLDGYLARRSGRGPTRHGAVLDAAADRLIQWSGAWFFALRAAPAFTPLPLWFPFALLARDATLVFVWLRLRRRRTNFEHELHGKVATVLVVAMLIAVALGLPTAVVVPAATLAMGGVLYSTIRYAMRMR
jgi:phosphatidylglycerophosphate synthase